MIYYEYELDKKTIIFHKDSIIHVQIGKNSGIYKTKYLFTPEKFGQAVMTYNAINIGNGYKKRLICNTLNKPVLARSISL